jgi:hypothetical protein
MGLGCLLSLSLASRALAQEGAAEPNSSAQGGEGEAAASEGEGEAAASEGEAAASEGEAAASEGEAAASEPEASAGEGQQPEAVASAAPPSEPTGRKAPQRISEAVTLEPPISDRLIIPPYMHDRRGRVQTKAVFPFYFERRTPESFERLIIPYYYRRGPKLNADVALGLIWSLRGPDRNTFILPPFYTHRKGKNWAVGLFPVFGTGVLGGHHHTIIPPLLTWMDGNDKTHHTVIGPYFDWKSERAQWRGLFPIFWDKKDDVDRFSMVPPVFFRFADDDPLRATTVVPPFYFRRTVDTKKWGLIPLVFRDETPEAKATTVPFLLFHHAKGPELFRLVTPALSYVRSKKRGKIWVSPIYQRQRGDKNMDAVAPIFFRTWDERDASRGLVIAPIFWHFRDPANDTLAILPFMARGYHQGIGSTWWMPLAGRYKSFERDEQTWWVLPTFHYGWTENSWFFNLHPLFYRKESPERSHWAINPIYYNFHNREAKTHRFAVAPIYWDFKNFAKQKRGQVFFPLYWDFENNRKTTRRQIGFPFVWNFRNENKERHTFHVFPFYTNWIRGDFDRTLVLNSYFEKKREPQGTRWQYHFFPFFSRGGINDERWWNVFYGLAGYEKRGPHRRARVFWIPFELQN